jgi:hypothetical protein
MQNNMAQKNIYVVLGLPRSGTSAITRALQALGVGLEGNLQPARSINPKGFWEDVDIMYGINRTVTHVNGDKIVTAEQLTEDSLTGKRLREIHMTAEKLLQQRMADSSQWGFKDVRTGEMLPFWQSVFAKLQLKENYIIALRHPLSRAHSNLKFNHHDIEYGLISWLDYLIRVVDETQGKNRVVVSYELMLQQPEQQLTHMRETLSIPADQDSDAISVYANQFLDKKLRHYAFDKEDLSRDPLMAISPLCIDVYELLLRAASGEISLNDEKFTSAWQEIKATYKTIMPVHHYISALLDDEKALQRQMKKIQKSLSWKLIYPLRIVDDYFRKQRTARREQNQWSRTT